MYSQFKNKQIIIVQNQVPSPVEGLVAPTLDNAYKETLREWERFIDKKEIVSIPLKNEIAYTLSRNKLVPLDNIFMKYIETVAGYLI